GEAYLDTATQRRSVAGHLALIGYEMDEGASAYTWLQFQVNATHTLTPAPGLRVTNPPARRDDPVIVFETLGPATLRPGQHRMTVFNWDNRGCCLPREALSAALRGSYPDLDAGDYLLFEQGRERRDVVRLSARPEIVPLTSLPEGFITVVRWSAATPLHADYC